MDVYKEIAKQSYEMYPLHKIGDYELVHTTPSIKFYKKGNDIIIGIRGTATFEDVKADAFLGLKHLEKSNRFQKDLSIVQNFQSKYPKSEFTYTGAGHSLGGAILDLLLERKLISKAKSYNPAIASSGVQNERIYNESDPLYKLMGKFDKNAEIRKNTSSAFTDLLSYTSPLFATIKGFQAHKLENI